MKTYTPKPRDIERRWYVVDARGAVLGRLASEVAKILRGKHKPIYAPQADTKPARRRSAAAHSSAVKSSTAKTTTAKRPSAKTTATRAPAAKASGAKASGTRKTPAPAPENAKKPRASRRKKSEEE